MNLRCIIRRLKININYCISLSDRTSQKSDILKQQNFLKLGMANYKFYKTYD